jgi:hypothetical protein
MQKRPQSNNKETAMEPEFRKTTGGFGGRFFHIWTHSIGGLLENDFIKAAKTDELYG